MTISHRKAFELLHQGLDSCLQFAPLDTQPAALREQVLSALDPVARQRLAAHWERCPACRGDLVLSARLRAEALERWPLTARPRRSQASLVAVVVGQKSLPRLHLLWQVTLLAAALLALAWILGNLLPQPAPVPGITTPEHTPPATLPAMEAATPTPDARLEALPQVVLTPFVQGRDVDHGRWSPDGRYLPFGQRAQSIEPGTDRTFTTFQVYDAQTGEICPLGGPWLGNFFPHGHAIWLADGRILLAAGREVVLARPCVAGSESLTDQFTEAVELARPAMMSRIARAQVVLTGQQAFWLYDSTTGKAQPIAGLRPNPGDSDGVYWSPSGEVFAINQVAQGGRSTLISLVEAATGQVSEVLQLPIEARGYSPWLEWLLEDVIYVFMSGGMGGLLLERQPDGGWSQTPFGMDMLGLDATQMANHQAFATVVDHLNGVFYLAVALREPHGYLLYVYSSASEQIQTYEVPPDTLLIDPRGGSGGTLPYQPEFSDAESPTDIWHLFELVDPGAGLQTLHVDGHRGRNYPLLNVNWLPTTQRVVFASSQGVSLVEASSGAPLAFWQLGGVQERIGYVGLDLSPDQGRAVVYAVIESQQTGSHSALYVVDLP